MVHSLTASLVSTIFLLCFQMKDANSLSLFDCINWLGTPQCSGAWCVCFPTLSLYSRVYGLPPFFVKARLINFLCQ